MSTKDFAACNFHEVLELVRLAHREEGITFSELESRGFAQKKVLEYLEVLEGVEIPPYEPSDIVMVWVEGDRIGIDFPLGLELPMNLGAMDALALRLALMYAESQGLFLDQSLSSLPEKLERLAFTDFSENQPSKVPLQTVVSERALDWVPLLEKAIGNDRPVVLNYFSLSSGSTTQRKILPASLHVRSGDWYVKAYQISDGQTEEGWRLFRLDRIRECRILDEIFDPHFLPEEGRDSLFHFEEEALTATRTRFVPPAARYIREGLFGDNWTEAGGDAVVLNYEVVGYPFYRNLVLQFGAEACILAPEEFKKKLMEELRSWIEGWTVAEKAAQPSIEPAS